MNQQTQTKRQFPYVIVSLILVAVLVVGIVVYSIMDSTGVVGKLTTAVKSDNYTISENELSVYQYQVALNQLAYEYLYYQYGIYQDTTGILKLYSSAEEYAYAMIPYAVNSEDIVALAYDYAIQDMVYCEGAKAASVTLDEDDKAEVDAFIDSLKEAADMCDVTYASYRKTSFGSGVSESDIRSAMEKRVLGNKYALQLEEEFSEGATENELKEYVENNKSTFYSTKYTSYELVSKDLEEKAKNCKTAEDVKSMICEYMVDKKFDDLYKSKITDASVEDPNGKDTTKAMVLETLKAEYELGENEKKFTKDMTDTYEKAGYDIYSSISTSTKTETNKVKDTGSAAYVDISTLTTATDLQKWIFGDGRAVGDTNVIKSTKTTSSGTDSSTTTDVYTWYLVTEAMVIDEEKTRAAYYMLLTDDKKQEAETGAEASTGDAASAELKTGEEKANAMYAALEADKTTEKFDELAKEYGSTLSTTLRESIAKESLGDEVDEWLFADDRKEGDIAKIKTSTGYYVLYYVEENEENWKLSARSGLAEEKLTAWLEEGMTKYHVTSNQKVEETTVVETVAATEAEAATA